MAAVREHVGRRQDRQGGPIRAGLLPTAIPVAGGTVDFDQRFGTKAKCGPFNHGTGSAVAGAPTTSAVRRGPIDQAIGGQQFPAHAERGGALHRVLVARLQVQFTR